MLKVGEQKALSLKTWAKSYEYMFDSVGNITQSTGNIPEIILMERGFSGFFSNTGEPLNRVLPYSKTAFSAYNPNKVPKQKFLQRLDIPLGTTETVRTFRTIDGYSLVTNMFSMHFGEIMSKKEISNPAFTFGLFLAYAETLSMRNREYCDAISSAPETTKLALVGAMHVTGDHVLKFVNSTEMHCCDHNIVPPMFPSFDAFNEVFLISAYQLIRAAGENRPSTAWTQFFREGKNSIKFELQRDVDPRFIKESESELPQILDSILETGQRFL